MSDQLIEILYLDDHILAINKPAGLRTIQDGFEPKLAHVRSALEPQFGRLWVVHRLDKETSGVLLLARSAAVHQSLNNQFTNREIKKEYRALCSGNPDRNDWDIELPLRINGDRSHRTIVDIEYGKPAKTGITVIKRFPGGYCLLSAVPGTGYTHQIRAHLAACSLPIIGDPLYQAKPYSAIMTKLEVVSSNRPIQANRLGLHAYEITFFHPVKQQTCHIQAPYPDDFVNLLDQVS
ncbi:MAG TPA: RluA family pseudouridine synthase [Longilinea sp.]|nr:RluA family pseudouridine synthase [Longilinea sp.]